jgi:four helix bundle protein
MGWLSGSAIAGHLERANSSGWLLPPVGRRDIADLLGHDIHKPHRDRDVDPRRASDRNDPGFCTRARNRSGAAVDDHLVSRPPGTFDHHRLDAFHVAREALRLGDVIARKLPRGYATLADQLRRALLAAYLGVAEASSRQGHDRMARFRCARGEASEAAAALEAVAMLGRAPEDDTRAVVALCDRLCAMLTRLAGIRSA